MAPFQLAFRITRSGMPMLMLMLIDSVSFLGHCFKFYRIHY